MNIKKRTDNIVFNFKWEKGCKTFFLEIYKNKPKIKLGKNIIYHKRYLWLNYSNKKEQERIWGKNTCNSDYHFCIIIPNIITLDTAYKGKKIFNSRINLTRLFKKDYHIYSNLGDDVQSC